MKEYIESFSLFSMAALIAVLSAGFTCLLKRMESLHIRWGGAVIIPLVLSYCAYWAPSWLGANDDQFGSWQLLFVGAWWIAGVVSSATVICTFSFYKNRKKPNQSVEPTPPSRGGSP